MSTSHPQKLPGRLLEHPGPRVRGLALMICFAAAASCRNTPAGQQTLKGKSAKRPDAPFVAFGFIDKSRVAAGAQTAQYTHVVALGSGDSFSTAEIEEDGSFALGLQTGELHAVGFVDASGGAGQVGAVLSSGNLQTLAPQQNGEVDLQEVAIQGVVATPGIDTAALIAALGLSETQAQTIAGQDDMLAASLRPTAEPAPARLETHSHWTWKDANQLAYLPVGDQAPTHLKLTYAMSSVSLLFASGSMSGPFSMLFDETVKLNGGMNGGTVSYPAGAEVPESVLRGSTASPPPGTEQLGLPLAVLETPPNGRYRLKAGATTHTFGPVVFDRAEFKNALGRVVPLIWGKPKVAGCEAGCELSAFSWKWFVVTNTGPKPAGIADLRLAARSQPQFMLSLAKGKRFYAQVSKTMLEGDIQMSAFQPAPGSDPALLTSLKDTELCGLAIATQDVTGVTHFFDSVDYDPDLCN